MDRADLLEIIRPEDDSLELKQGVTSALAKDIVAFANTEGGMILVGVDNDQNIVGVGNLNDEEARIRDIAYNCDPAVPIHIDCVEEESVFVIYINESNSFHRASDGYYEREGSQSRKLDHDEVQKRMLAKGNTLWDSQICEEFTYPVDFDEDKFNKYLEECDIQRREISSVEDCLVGWGVAVRKEASLQMKRAGVLFFANDPLTFFESAEVICALYSSESRADLEKRDLFRKGTVGMIRESVRWVENNLDSRIKIEGLKRTEFPEIPRVVLREAITNALMHRDYSRQQESVQIDLFPSKLVVRNPGGLVEGMRPEDLGDTSMRRNNNIANLLDKADFVDRVGSGIPRMKQELSNIGLPEPEFATNSHFKVEIYREADRGSRIDFSSANLTTRQRNALRYMYSRGSITTRVYAEEFNVSTDIARQDINDMIEKGFVEKVGKTKGAFYKPAD